MDIQAVESTYPPEVVAEIRRITDECKAHIRAITGINDACLVRMPEDEVIALDREVRAIQAAYMDRAAKLLNMTAPKIVISPPSQQAT